MGSHPWLRWKMGRSVHGGVQEFVAQSRMDTRQLLWMRRRSILAIWCIACFNCSTVDVGSSCDMVAMPFGWRILRRMTGWKEFLCRLSSQRKGRSSDVWRHSVQQQQGDPNLNPRVSFPLNSTPPLAHHSANILHHNGKQKATEYVVLSIVRRPHLFVKLHRPLTLTLGMHQWTGLS